MASKVVNTLVRLAADKNKIIFMKTVDGGSNFSVIIGIKIARGPLDIKNIHPGINTYALQ